MRVVTVPGVFTHAPGVSTIAIATGGVVLGAMISFAVWRREGQTPRWQLAAQVALTAALLLMLTWRRGADPGLLVPAGFTVASVPLALLDLRTGRLPNWLLLVAYLLTIAGALVATLADLQPEPLAGALVGAAAFAVFYAALYVFLPGQMGGGDLKLSVLAGAALGWQGWPREVSLQFPVTGLRLLIWLLGVLLLIWLLQAVAYLIVRALRGQRQVLVLRHGPFLILGTIVALLLVR